MKRSCFVLLVLFTVSCGTTSRKLVVLPPRPFDAPVEVFQSEATSVTYEKVCEIETYDQMSAALWFSDVEKSMIREARKCGADGVIVADKEHWPAPNVASGSGIRITGRSVMTEEEKIRSFTMAVRSGDLEKLRELVASVPKKLTDRTLDDSYLLNFGLYVATLKGLNCDKRVIKLLQDEYGAFFPYFEVVPSYSFDEGKDSDTPLCLNIVERSYPLMKDREKVIVKIHNYYVGHLKSFDSQGLNQKADRFSNLLKSAASEISAVCKESGSSPICAARGFYLKVANETKNSRFPAVRKNARDVLSILN